MTVSLDRRLTLRALMEQAWQQVEGQARTMLKGRWKVAASRAGPARGRGHAPWREGVPLGYTVRKCWTTLWGSLEQVRVPRLRGWKEIGLLERYERHGLDEVLFALTVGG